MNELWPLLLLVIPYQSIHAQEVQHAPTVEQCRADQRLWLSRIEVPTVTSDYMEIRAWGHEMHEWESVDPTFFNLYHKTASENCF